MRIKIISNDGQNKYKRQAAPKFVPNPNFVPPPSDYAEKRTVKVDVDRLIAERDAALDVLRKFKKHGIPTLESEIIVPGSVRREEVSPDGRYQMVSFIIAR